MIESFQNLGTEDIFNGRDTKAARKVCPQNLWPIARRKLNLLNSVVKLDELRIPPGNQLEALRGTKLGQYSIRINRQYRICFIWGTIGIEQVEIIDYH